MKYLTKTFVILLTIILIAFVFKPDKPKANNVDPKIPKSILIEGERKTIESDEYFYFDASKYIEHNYIAVQLNIKKKIGQVTGVVYFQKSDDGIKYYDIEEKSIININHNILQFKDIIENKLTDTLQRQYYRIKIQNDLSSKIDVSLAYLLRH